MWGRICYSFNIRNLFSSRIHKDGYAGSLTVLDMKKPVKIEKMMLKTKCAWSPFEGVAFPGSVAMTIIQGKVFKV